MVGRIVAAALAMIGAAGAVGGQCTAALRWAPSGMLSRFGSGVLRTVELTPAAPSRPPELPHGFSPQQWGRIDLGPAGRWTCVLGTDGEGDQKLLVDGRGDGRLTAATWDPTAYRGAGGGRLVLYRGRVDLSMTVGGVARTGSLVVHRYDPSDPVRAALRGALLFEVDCGFEGRVALAGVSYAIAVRESPVQGALEMGSLGIDVNGNGVFGERGEAYGMDQPFAIAGVTWQVARLDCASGALEVSRSQRSAVETPPIPNLEVGRIAPAFSATDMQGRAVRFPEDFRGRLVLLCFWSATSAASAAQAPTLARVSAAHRWEGLEALGVCVDPAARATQIAAFARDRLPGWRQVHDARGALSAVADLYGGRIAPPVLLVDGSTGAIIAGGAALRRERLEQCVVAALRALADRRR